MNKVIILKSIETSENVENKCREGEHDFHVYEGWCDYISLYGCTERAIIRVCKKCTYADKIYL